ncbi:DUF2779 domain-containing protein [Spiroplasma endosymbiont of Aspidapion aeneum]|uniref:DUF2779 domain-containing protein n=1 Tax=Spiroplasma endosymbiont of Aspidapion aeneum TaxID=3066276 RepID=UPI00313AF156
MLDEIKYPISKRTFKLAFSKCWNIAWIFASKTNFNLSKQKKLNNEYFYNFDVKLDEGDDFYSVDSYNIKELYENELKSLFINDNENDGLQEDITENDGFEKICLIKEIVSNYALDEESLSSSLEDGNITGAKAREYFSFLLKKWNLEYETNYKYVDLSEFARNEDAISNTINAFRDERVKYIYEATFATENNYLIAKCDVLEIIDFENKVVDILEVKASTKFKWEHFFDLAYQKIVLERCGYTVRNIRLVLLNSLKYCEKTFLYANKLSNFDEYKVDEKKIIDELKLAKTFPNDYLYNKPVEINIENIFHVYDYENITKKSLGLNKLWRQLIALMGETQAEQNKFLNDFGKFLSEQNPSPYCYKISQMRGKKVGFQLEKKYCGHVYSCENISYSIDIPSIKHISGLRADKIGDIVNTFPEFYDFYWYYEMELDEIQKRLNKAAVYIINYWKKFNKAQIDICGPHIKVDDELLVDPKRLWTLHSLIQKYNNYPVYMYDFETTKWAMPKYKNAEPYDQMIFQYSLHVLEDDNFDYRKEEDIKHHFWISNNKDDPRPQFIANFLRDMYNYGKGVYVAYHRSFERTQLKKLAMAFPQFINAIKYIYDNTIDLEDFFKLKGNPFLIYHPNFYGSSSIKKTQPALEQEFSYKDLKINNGLLASEVFRAYCDDIIEDAIWEKMVKPDMIKYCNRDTLAMVVILQRVIEIYNKAKNNYNVKG